MKKKSLQNGKITLSFVNMAKSCPSHGFFMLQICLNAIRENKILAKISEFTVTDKVEQLNDGRFLFEQPQLIFVLKFVWYIDI